MAAMTLTAFVQVVARYVFNYSFVWALELNGVLFAWLIFLGMSYGVRVGAHIGVDAVVKLLKAAGGARRRHGRRGAVHRLCADRRRRRLAVRQEDVRRRHRDAGPADRRSGSRASSCRSGFALLALRFGQAFVRLWRGEQTTLLHDEAAEALKLRQRPVPLGEVPE